ncbi:hypothetical protein C7974DRAFT_65591 [Boeremia exigua]|uniref:uncharacterized protein n=1 Tax=Boeremia exigua TaxID=749465 RepID=UPI001E8D4A39|nr:uncharacterized protein C7974DRAFT_65591 [Boeremia exigua]KAH6613835.1 hypothetical protein C7974DRAFT_65591 [Boeremia exigua]
MRSAQIFFALAAIGTAAAYPTAAISASPDLAPQTAEVAKRDDASVDEISAGLYIDWDSTGGKEKREKFSVDEISAGLYIDWDSTGGKN